MSNGVARVRGRRLTSIASSVLLSVLMLGIWGVAGTPQGADAAAPPPAPTGLTPNGTSASGNPLLSWDPTPGATSYKVMVKSSPGNVVEVNNQTVYSNHYAFSEELTLGDYIWSVTAYGQGGASPSTGSTFTKTQVAGPVLQTPADGAVIEYPVQNPTFSWDAVTGVKSYTLEVSTDSAFSPVSTDSYTTQATSFTLTTTQAFGQIYYWRVTGKFTNSAVNTAVSATRSYQVVWGAGGLAAPALLSPSNSATNSVHDVVLKWTAVPGAATYQVQASPNQDWTNNLSIDVVTDATLYAPKKSLDNANYFWRVRATTSQGSQSAWSPIWQFRRVPMQKVTLLSPANTPSGGYPTQSSDLFLSWNPVPEASAYELEISADPNFSVVTTSQVCITNHTDWGPYIDETGVSGVSAVPGPGGNDACPLKRKDLQALFATAGDNVTVYWRVRGLDYYQSNERPDPWNQPTNAPINGPWSDTWSFQYHADLGAPILMSPANGASVHVPKLSWATVPGTRYYSVSIDEQRYKWNSSTSSCVVDGGLRSLGTYKTASTSFVPSLKKAADLPPTPGKCASTYTWTVTATNGVNHTSPTPQARTFVLSGIDAGTATSTITPTAVQDPQLPGQVEFTWNPIAGADRYEVRWFLNGGSTYTALGDFNKEGRDDFLPYTAAFTTTRVQNPGNAAYQVVALDASNAQIAASAQVPITVTWPAATQIGPTNCVPSNQACTPEPSTPVTQWTQIDGADVYRQIVALDAGFTNKVRQYLVYGTNLRQVEALPDNQAGQAYYWFVQPCRQDWKTNSMMCGANENAPGASIWAFQKRSAPITGAKTLQPTSPTPVPDNACGASGLSTVRDMPTFCWDGYGGVITNDVAAMRYHIQVATDSTFSPSSLIDDVEVDQASYTAYKSGSIPTSIRHLTYPEGQLYWRVQARDATGNLLTWSPVQSITKSTPAVTLNSPANGATVSSSPSLSWNAMPFAAQYTVEVYANGDTNWSSTNLRRSQTTSFTAYTATQGGGAFQNLPQGSYAWRVRAIDANGKAGAWSTGRTFTVSSGSPSLLTPAESEAISTLTLLFTWTPVPGAVSYRLQASKNSNLSSPFENRVSFSTAWAPLNNVPNATIYWNVQALDANGGVLGTSTTGSFDYTSSRPTASRPTGVTGDAQVTLHWTASPVALVGPITGYTITAYIGNVVDRTVDIAATDAAADPNNASYTVTGLVNNTAYTFTVTPNDANGPGTESSKSSSLTPQQWAPFSSSTNCVKRLYADLMGVTHPTASQIQIFVSYISSGHSCADVALSMWNTGAFQDQFGIARLYQAYFLRIPDYGGINYWTGLHRTNGLTLSSMSAYFAQSAEFIGTYGHLSNAGFMNLIYNNVLHRAPDPGGYNYWLGMLNQNRIGRGDVMLLFSESPEYTTTQMPTMKADLLILEFLRRTPLQAEVDHYAPLMPYRGETDAQKAQMNADLLVQIKDIMSTTEYKARAN